MGAAENLGLIIAIVGSAIAIVGVMMALFLWNRGESNTDRNKFDEENKLLRRELIDCVRAIEEEAKSFRERCSDETREFHGRLCKIEENRNKISGGII